MEFRDRYGPWAVVAGASEGTGRAFALQLAAQGISPVLIARRDGPLQAVAAEVRQAGVECVTATIDLGQADAHEKVLAAAAGREVGLYISNAGGDPNGSRFLDKGPEAWRSLVTRNVLTTMLCCHGFAGPMKARGRGGLLLVNSGACWGGGSFMACYTGSKAFELCFAESLWAELKPHGVDVLTLVMGMTDTPEFNRLLAEKGLQLPPGTADAGEVAALGLARLADGPVQSWGLGEDDAMPMPQTAAQRRERVRAIDATSGAVFGE